MASEKLEQFNKDRAHFAEAVIKDHDDGLPLTIIATHRVLVDLGIHEYGEGIEEYSKVLQDPYIYLEMDSTDGIGEFDPGERMQIYTENLNDLERATQYFMKHFPDEGPKVVMDGEHAHTYIRRLIEGSK